MKRLEPTDFDNGWWPHLSPLLTISIRVGGAVPHGRRSCPAERRVAGASDVPAAHLAHEASHQPDCFRMSRAKSRVDALGSICGVRVMDQATSIQLRLFVQMVAISVSMAVLGFTLLTQIF